MPTNIDIFQDKVFTAKANFTASITKTETFEKTQIINKESFEINKLINKDLITLQLYINQIKQSDIQYTLSKKKTVAELVQYNNNIILFIIIYKGSCSLQSTISQRVI